MDTFTPFQGIDFTSITFSPSMFEEYKEGRRISSGNTSCTITILGHQNGFTCAILNNNIEDLIMSNFQFDICFTLQDRYLLVIHPRQTNVQDIYFNFLLHSGVGYTRNVKNFTNTEPVVGSIYTDNGIVVKLSFKLLDPERLLELY